MANGILPSFAVDGAVVGIGLGDEGVNVSERQLLLWRRADALHDELGIAVGRLLVAVRGSGWRRKEVILEIVIDAVRGIVAEGLATGARRATVCRTYRPWR